MPAIYASGLLVWLIGPGLKQGNVYDNPLPKMNEWMNEWGGGGGGGGGHSFTEDDR